MLENWFNFVIESNVWFQQDGAPAHFAITVWKYLNEVFSSLRIGRGSATLPASLDWTPRNPDLTTCEFLPFYRADLTIIM